MITDVFKDPRQLLLLYALKWLKTPYHFGTAHGGDDFLGVDCSGFVCECMQAVGLFRNRLRINVRDMFRNLGVVGHDCGRAGWSPINGGPGCLQFLADDPHTEPFHVNICVSEQYVIGAIGGDRDTDTDKEAAEDNGFVKLRPYNYYQNKTRMYVDPFIIGQGRVWPILP